MGLGIIPAVKLTVTKDIVLNDTLVLTGDTVYIEDVKKDIHEYDEPCRKVYTHDRVCFAKIYVPWQELDCFEEVKDG